MSNATLPDDEQIPDFYSLVKSQESENIPDFYSYIKSQESEKIPDFYSHITEKQSLAETLPPKRTPKEEKIVSQEESITPDIEKPSILSNLGQAFAYQMQSGGPSGAPSTTPKQAKKIATEVGTIAAVEAAFAPIYGAAAAAKYAPRVLKAITRLTQAGTTGAAVATTSKLVETGELPTSEELLKNGLEWAAIDGILQALHMGIGVAKTTYDFGKAVNSIAKKDQISRTKVLSNLWEATKNYIRQKRGKVISTPEDIRVEDVQDLIETTKQAEKEGLAPEAIKESEPIQPVEEPKPVKPVPPINNVPTPQTDFSKKTLKMQKDYMLDKLDEAIKNPTDAETLTIKVPEDGIFKVKNNPNNLELVKRRVELGWPTDKSSKKPLHIAQKPYKPRKKAPPIEKSAQQSLGKALPKKNQEPITPPHRKPVMGKEQATKRSDIIKLFRKAFNDPIRLRKFKERALGIHKMWPKVTRLLHANDIETAAHEIGHNLHTTLYGEGAKTAKEQEAQVIRHLKPFLNELKPLAPYEPFTLEGFAEFTRLYVTDPVVAQKLAPKFYQKFENDLDAQYPELKTALLKARDYYESYLQGTPESRIDAQLSYSEDEPRLKAFVDWIKKGFDLDNLKTQFLDDVFPAKRVVAELFDIPITEVENLKDARNLYRTLRVLKGAVGKGDVFIYHETFDPITLEKTGEGLKLILDELKDPNTYREFNRFLVARRVIEKKSQGIATGIHIGDAKKVYEDFKVKYDALAKKFDEYNDQLLKYAQRCGLISAEQYKLIKDSNLSYAPFQRVIDDKNKGIISSAGRVQAGKPIKKMKGSTRDIIAPIESVIKNTYAIIINSEKNLAGQVLGKLSQMKNAGQYVERVPTPTKLKAKISSEEVVKQWQKNAQAALPQADKEFWKKLAAAMPDFFTRFGAGTYPAGENIVTVFYDGKPIYFEVSPALYEMWSKGLAPYTANLLTKILRMPARLLRAGAILNPKFIQKNFIRDTWGSWLFTRYGKSIKDPAGLFIDTLYQPFSMLAQAAKKGDIYIQWLKSGGGMSTMQSLDRPSLMKHIERLKEGFKPYQINIALRAIAEISEEANRLSEFARALEIEGKTRLGREIAAFAARDLSLDFAKMGLQTKALNQIISFFNATVQGTDKFIRTLANPDARNEFIARVLGFVILPSLFLAWLNKDDEDIKELQDQEKDFNFLIKIGKNILKIPVPFETGVLAHGLTQRMYDFFMSKDPNAFEGFIGSILDATMPNFIPTFANPVIEAQANKNFFTGTRIVPGSKENLISKYQYKNSTSLTARLLGRAINYMIGEDTRSKAASPAVIDHFITSWTGGLGRLMVTISDAALEAAGLGDKIPKIEQPITERLGLDAFSARYPRSSTKSIEKFYDNYQDAIARTSSLAYASKMNLESQENLEKGQKRINKLYDIGALKAAYQSIQMCQREINNIMNSPDISSEEKKMMTDELYFQMIAFAKAANKDIEEYRKRL